MKDDSVAATIVKRIREGLSDPALGRVFCVVGPNGAGKSRLLRKLKLDFPEEKIIYLKSGRKLGPHLSVPALANGEKLASNDIFGDVLAGFVAKESRLGVHREIIPDFESAIHIILARIVSEHKFKIERYKDELFDWVENGANSELKPVKPESAIKFVEEALSKIFSFEVRIDSTNQPPNAMPGIKFKKDDTEFSISGLSDGESQILLLAIFLASSPGGRYFFIVDEPELHLNDAKAIDIWGRIEDVFSESIFIYATHSVLFSTREKVDAVFTIDSRGGVFEINKISKCTPELLREIAGVRIQILSSDKSIVFCEDKFSKEFIDWITNFQFNVIEVGGVNNVISAVRKNHGWESLVVRSNKYCGVRDRDLLSDSDINDIEVGGLFCFPYNEVESIMIHPVVVKFMFELIKSKDFSSSAYNSFIIESAKRLFGMVISEIAHDIGRRYEPKIEFRIENISVDNIKIGFGNGIEEEFRLRSEYVRNVILDGDVEKILNVFNGKKMYCAISGYLSREMNYHLVEAHQKFKEMMAIDGFYSVINEIYSINLLSKKIQRHLT